jgi:hypothetical protein
MKKIFIFLLLFFSIPLTHVYAEYILPYPSIMPGNRWYPVKIFLEKVQYYWYFGEMGRAKYHLQLADEYLVESKTLFEYGQYRLAITALEKSNANFSLAYLAVRDVVGKNKDTGETKAVLEGAGKKHEQVLADIGTNVPETVNWQEEKKDIETFSIAQLLKEAIIIRKYAER